MAPPQGREPLQLSDAGMKTLSEARAKIAAQVGGAYGDIGFYGSAAHLNPMARYDAPPPWVPAEATVGQSLRSSHDMYHPSIHPDYSYLGLTNHSGSLLGTADGSLRPYTASGELAGSMMSSHGMSFPVPFYNSPEQSLRAKETAELADRVAHLKRKLSVESRVLEEDIRLLARGQVATSAVRKQVEELLALARSLEMLVPGRGSTGSLSAPVGGPLKTLSDALSGILSFLNQVDTGGVAGHRARAEASLVANQLSTAASRFGPKSRNTLRVRTGPSASDRAEASPWRYRSTDVDHARFAEASAPRASPGHVPRGGGFVQADPAEHEAVMEDMWVEIEDIIREIVETTRGAAAHVMEILEGCGKPFMDSIELDGQEAQGALDAMAACLTSLTDCLNHELLAPLSGDGGLSDQTLNVLEAAGQSWGDVKDPMEAVQSALVMETRALIDEGISLCRALLAQGQETQKKLKIRDGPQIDEAYGLLGSMERALADAEAATEAAVEAMPAQLPPGMRPRGNARGNNPRLRASGDRSPARGAMALPAPSPSPHSRLSPGRRGVSWGQGGARAGDRHTSRGAAFGAAAPRPRVELPKSSMTRDYVVRGERGYASPSPRRRSKSRSRKKRDESTTEGLSTGQEDREDRERRRSKSRPRSRSADKKGGHGTTTGTTSDSSHRDKRRSRSHGRSHSKKRSESKSRGHGHKSRGRHRHSSSGSTSSALLRGYAPKNHMDLPAKLVVAADSGALNIRGYEGDSWASRPWKEVKEAQLGEYKKELRAWKERKAQRDKEKEHLKEQGLTWVSDEDDYAPPPPPPLFHARGGSVHHDKPWAPAPLGLPHEREERHAPPAYTIHNTRLLQIQRKVALTLQRAAEFKQQLERMPSVQQLRDRVQGLKEHLRSVGGSPNRRGTSPEIVNELAKAEKKLKEVEGLENMVGPRDGASDASDPQRVPEIHRVLQKHREELTKVARAELARIWEAEMGQFAEKMREIQVELRRLPTVRAIEQQREAARAVHSRLAGNDRDGLAKVKRVLEKCKVAEERRQEMEGKARRLRLAVLKRVQPYLTEVARIAKSVGFPDPLAGALKALGVEEGSEEADSDAVMDVLGGVPRGRYHNPILREDVLRGQPDESPRRARGRAKDGLQDLDWLHSKHRAGDLAGVWDSRSEQEAYTRDMLGAMLDPEAAQLEEDVWTARLLERSQRPPKHRATNAEAARRALGNLSYTPKAMGLFDDDDALLGSRRRRGGRGDDFSVAPITAANIWKTLDDNLEKMQRGLAGDDAGAALEDDDDPLAALRRNQTDTGGQRERGAEKKGQKPVVREGTLLSAVEALAEWKGVGLEELWREYGARGASGGITLEKLQRLLEEVVPHAPLSSEVRYVAVLMDTSGEGRVALREFEEVAEMVQIRDGHLVVPRDGVSADEFLVLMAKRARSMPGGLPVLFDTFDRDMSGDIDMLEATQMVGTMLPGLRDKEKRRVLIHLMGGQQGTSRAGRITLRDLEALLQPYMDRLARGSGMEGFSSSDRGLRAQEALGEVLGTLGDYAQREQRRGGRKGALVDFLWAKFCRSGTGKLTLTELESMLRAAGREAFRDEARSLWLLMDLNGDKVISKEEFREGIGAAQVLMRRGGGGERGGADDDNAGQLPKGLLLRLARAAKERGGVSRLMEEFDVNHNGVLESSELARLFRRIMPGLRDDEVRVLLLRLGALDPSGRGRVDVHELRQALEPYLEGAEATSGDLFKMVDEYLRSTGEAFQTMWQRYEAQYNGSSAAGLRRDALATMLREVAQGLSRSRGRAVRISEAQIDYVWKILDINGDGRVQMDEFLQVYQYATQTGRGLAFKDRVTVEDVLQRIAQTLKDARQIATLYKAYDKDGDGTLGPRELAKLFQDSVPGITPEELQVLLLHLGNLDASRDGQVSVAEITQALGPYFAAAAATPHAAHAAQQGPADPRKTRLVQGLASVPRETLIDCFRRLDMRGHGLVRADVNELVRMLLPGVPVDEGKVRYLSVVLDLDGDGRITQRELLEVLDMAHRLGSDMVLRDNVTVRDVLQRLGTKVGSLERAKELFYQFDRNKSGTLDGQELARLFRFALPALTTRDVQMLLLALQNLDADGNGLVSFAEFIDAVAPYLPDRHAAPAVAAVQAHAYSRPGSPAVQGGAHAHAHAASPHHAAYGGYPPAQGHPTVVPPSPAGRPGSAHGSVHGGAGASPREVDFFGRLESHLLGRRQELDDLWKKYDRTGRGLDRVTLAALVREVVPEMELSQEQLRLLACMLDIDGDGQITKQELLDNFTMMNKMGKKLVVTDDGLTGHQLMVRLATLLQSPEAVAVAFKKYDKDGTGFLDASEVLQMVSDAFPGATADEKRALLYHVVAYDLNMDGFISLDELQRALAPYFGTVAQGPATAHGHGTQGAQAAQGYGAQAPSGSASFRLLDKVVHTVRANPNVLSSAAMGRGWNGLVPSSHYHVMLADALPMLSPAEAALLGAVMRLEIRTEDGRAPMTGASATKVSTHLEKALTAAQLLLTPSRCQALLDFKTWAGRNGENLLANVHHLTQGQVHAELPMEYLERIVEMWGQHTPPMHRSSVLLWLHDIDLTGMMKMRASHIVERLAHVVH